MNDTDTESGLVFLKLTIPEPRLGLEPLKVRDFNETRPRREVSEYPDLHIHRIDSHFDGPFTPTGNRDFPVIKQYIRS